MACPLAGDMLLERDVSDWANRNDALVGRRQQVGAWVARVVVLAASYTQA